jgi:uncharacterized membrane protein
LSPTGVVAAWGAAFVASHLAMSHPLRRPMVARLGARGFSLVYSAVSLLTFVMMVRAYKAGPEQAPLWAAPQAVWIVGAIVMWLASVLLAGSLRKNPAMLSMSGGHKRVAIGRPTGVFRITRHPMMWAFALWAIVHIVVIARPADIALAVAILSLALIGAAGQDRKKAVQLGQAWADWRGATSFVPFAKGLALPDAFALTAGTAIFLLATWLHPVRVGVWQWL